MICHIKIKLTKTILKTAKTNPTATDLSSKPTRTTNVLPQGQRQRKTSSMRRSPRKKKTVNYVEDATEDVQSSETGFRHTRALLSADETHCHTMKSTVTTVAHSTVNVANTAQTELSSMPETSLTDDEICEKLETEVASDLDIKGREVSYATSVLQHFIPCGGDVALRTDISLLKNECPVYGSETVTNQTLLPVPPREDTTSSHKTSTGVEFKGNEYVGNYQGSLGVKESEEIKRRKNAGTVRKIEGETDEMALTNKGERTGCTCSFCERLRAQLDCSGVCVCECDRIVANVFLDNLGLGWLLLCQE